MMSEISSSKSWSDFEQSLESLGKKQKGDLFEELTRLHLMTDPTFSTKITNIWSHSDIPQHVVDELDLQQPEIGVDLVAQVKDGSYWAIQCKFHQDRTANVSYDEISTFLSITERQKTYLKLSHRLVCTSANGISHRIGDAHKEKLGYLTSVEFSKLGAREFEAFRNLLAGQYPKFDPKDPWEHQKRALRKTTDYFADQANVRGKIIHPCGSGKTYTGYWLSQALGAKKILIAVPSLTLVRQTIEDWATEAVANGLNMDWMAVCSDEDVSKVDDAVMRAADLGIEVDTDPDLVAEFLANSVADTKVLITTYQSGRVVSEAAQKAEISFDLGVYDEAHKTAGRKDKAFAHLLSDANIKVKRRIFMTATEREFKGDSADIISMDDEDVYGNLIDFFSFKEAIEQVDPILSDYKIVTTFVTKTEIEQLINNNRFVKANGNDWSIEGDSSTIASLIALRKSMKEYAIKHVVSFHSSIARSKEFMELNNSAEGIEDLSIGLSSFHLSGKDSTGVRKATLDRFIDAEPSLITNARCLTEGVNVPAIDAVLFADPKQSKVDIVQAAGRALRRFKGKKFGYIIIPVVIEEEQSFDPILAFSQIINVISAMGMSDERIIEEFKSLVAGSQMTAKIVEIDIPHSSTNINIREFLSNIEILVWDRLSFAKSIVGESDFVRWMRQSTNLSEKSIKNYSNAVRKISNDLVRLKLSYSSLEDLMQSEDLDRLKKEYFDIVEYKELDIRGKGMYSAGFNKLIDFHQSRNVKV